MERTESTTSGEIHVHIVYSLLPLETPRQRAVRAFPRAAAPQDPSRNGVLLFVVMKKRRFEILADVGIDDKVDAAFWDEIAEQTSERIEHDGFAEGLAHGVEAIGKELAKHFPPRPDDENELPDRPTLG